jgi:cell division inhibitor SulA
MDTIEFRILASWWAQASQEERQRLLQRVQFGDAQAKAARITLRDVQDAALAAETEQGTVVHETGPSR